MKKTNCSNTPAFIAGLALIASLLVSSSGTMASAETGGGWAVNGSSYPKTASSYPLLSRYAVDLTALAREGHVGTGGYKSEIRLILKTLAESTARNPVLIGDSTRLDAAAIAKALAERIVSSNAPENLVDTRIFALSLDRLFAGTKEPAQLVVRLQSILTEATGSHGQVILFIDDLHQLVGSYANQQASAAICDALSHGQLRLLGADTANTYAEYIAADQSLNGLFQAVPVSDESASAADMNGEGGNNTAEEFTGEKISTELRELMQNARSSSDRVSVILQADYVKSGALSTLLKRHGVLIGSRLPEVGAMKIEIPVKAIEELAASGLTNHLSPDRKIESFGHITVTTGADAIRSGYVKSGSADGSGIGIAVLDSGVDIGDAAFTTGGRLQFSKDFTGDGDTNYDPYGHGTHVTSSAAGVSTTDGNSYQGIAPNANIINLRVLDSQGTGTVSSVLSALDWILSAVDPTQPVSSTNPTNQQKYNIRVVNMSLGAPAIDSYKNDPLCRAVRHLVDTGVVVVAAAGNDGKDSNGNKIYGRVHSPGNEPSVLTVGAANTFGTDARNDDSVATYSSRGPTRSSWTDSNGLKHYDNLIKPDLIAPGNKLIYAESDMGNSPNVLVTESPQLDSGITDSTNKRLMYLSGTSMATPIVSGAVALMLQVNPKLTPNMIKMILMYSAQPLAGFNMFEQGAGELNIEGAVRTASLIRQDLPSSPAAGTTLLSTTPSPKSTIAGQTFSWSQGVLLNYSFTTGTNLIKHYQKIYDLGVVMGDGIIVGNNT